MLSYNQECKQIKMFIDEEIIEDFLDHLKTFCIDIEWLPKLSV